MGYTRLEPFTPVKGRRQTDKTHRSLVATAATVAILALVACWFGTREVKNGIVNYEGRKSARDWAVSFTHSLSQIHLPKSAAPLRPYSAETSPERFTGLDNAMFEGEILSYRLYAPDGIIVASSQFEDIGSRANDVVHVQFRNLASGQIHFELNEPGDLSQNDEWSATAYTPLMRGSDIIGIFEVTVDVSERARQLNRLRYMGFAALAGLLAAIFGILGFSISRTLQKQRDAQQALALSERQHRQLLDDAPDSMVIHNQEEVIYVNEAAVVLHGAASREELLGTDPIELVPEEKRAEVLKHRYRALSDRQAQSTVMLGRRRLDGTIVETDSIGISIDWDGQSCILIQSRDMTDRRAAQRAIAEREAQLTAFMEHTRSVIFIKSLDNRMVLINRQFEEFYGTPATSVVGNEAFYPTSGRSARAGRQRGRQHRESHIWRSTGRPSRRGGANDAL
jgi:PAS domain S-box-containing protein